MEVHPVASLWHLSVSHPNLTLMKITGMYVYRLNPRNKPHGQKRRITNDIAANTDEIPGSAPSWAAPLRQKYLPHEDKTCYRYRSACPDAQV